jgi:heme-degrading monooxygenase HmoA
VAYLYQVDFDVRPDQMSELEIGSSLERVLGYLRALLPNQPGFVSVSAVSSLDFEDKTHLVIVSLWEGWEDLQSHQASSLAEEKVLSEFEPHVTLEDLRVHLYKEVD